MSRHLSKQWESIVRIEMDKRQRTRRKTLFPLPAKEVCKQRSIHAGILHGLGYSVYAIRQIMNLSPEQVRNYIAKSKQ